MAGRGWRLVGHAAAFLALAGCFVFKKAPPLPPKPPGGSITVGIGASGSLDPALATGEELLVVRTACDGLASSDYETGRPMPAIASWSVTEGATKIRLSLTPGMKFHDGVPVDARAIAANLSRIAGPVTQSPWASLLSSIAGFAEVQSGAAAALSGLTIVDDRTLLIALSTPFADFPSVLGHPGMTPISPSEWAKEPDQPVEPVCAGPYRVRPGEGSYRLTRDRSYVGRNEGFARVDAADEIIIRAFETDDDAFEAFKRGEVQAAPVPPIRAAEASGSGHVRRTTSEVTYLAFDVTKPETSNPRFRQGISLAVDRFAIIDAAFGDGRQAMIRWLSLEPGTAESKCSLYGRRRTADPERARQVFGEAGAPQGLKIPLYFDSSKIGRLVAQALRVQVKDALGVELDPQPLDASLFEQSLRNRTAAAVWIVSSSVDIPSPQLLLESLFADTGGRNLFGFSDQGFNDLGRAARATTSQEDRERFYEQAEDAICDKMPAVPLWTGVSHWIFDPSKMRVEGRERIDVFGGLLLRHSRAASVPGV